MLGPRRYEAEARPLAQQRRQTAPTRTGWGIQVSLRQRTPGAAPTHLITAAAALG